MGCRANFVVYQRDAQYRGFRCCDILAVQPLARNDSRGSFMTLQLPWLENTVIDDVVVIPLDRQRHHDRIFVVVNRTSRAPRKGANSDRRCRAFLVAL